MKKTITKGMMALPILIAMLFTSFGVNAQTAYIYFSAYPDFRGSITVDGNADLSDYDGDFTVGSTIHLSAVPSSGNEFVRWQDQDGNELSTSENYDYEVLTDDDMEITAIFRLMVPRFTVAATVIPAEAGTVIGGTGNITSGNGTTLEVSNNDEAHFHYEGWSFSADPTATKVATTNDYYFVVTQDTMAYAHYTYMNQSIEVTAYPNNSTLGSVTINGEPTNSAVLTEQTDNTFVAIPSTSGVNFEGWYLVNGNQKALVSENTTMIVNLPPFSEPRTYEAAFVGPAQTLTCQVSAINEGGTPAGPAASTYNSQVTIRAQVASGYEFVAWYEDLNGDGVFADDEIVQGAGADYTFYITRNRVFGAKYHHLPMTITITNDATKGTLSTENEFQVEYNAPVTIAIDENPGYHFTGWTGIASNDNPLTIEHVTTNYNLTANYVNTYTFNATASDGGTVTVTPQNGTFNAGESVSAQATADEGMVFAYWEVNDGTSTSQSTANPFEVQEIHNNYQIVAHFVHKYSLTLVASSPLRSTTSMRVLRLPSPSPITILKVGASCAGRMPAPLDAWTRILRFPPPSQSLTIPTSRLPSTTWLSTAPSATVSTPRTPVPSPLLSSPSMPTTRPPFPTTPPLP